MKEELLKRLVPHGQEHLLAFWDELDPSDRTALARQIDRIDFDLIGRLFCHRDDQTDMGQIIDRAGPPPGVRLDPAENRFMPDQARQRGQEALAAGQLGVILVAGGQGTRLGFDHPKGMFSIGPVSGRPLFQIHVEKIIALGRRHGVRIPLYLMTSPATHDETVRFFADNGRFGLAAEDLTIFCQGTMPVIDAADGRVLLDQPGRVAVSPDGHGGMLAALGASGALDDVRRRDIRQLFYFQVDNPLVDVGSAELVGHHLLAGSELTSQVVAKTDWQKRVGNVVEVDRRLRVIEYSDLPDAAAKRLNPDGSLAIWAGSIAVHVIDAALLHRSIDDAEALPFHLARKKTAHVDADGRRIEPTEPNAIKFERFIFDLIPSAEGAIVVEIDPSEGFAPLKNASGADEDTPEAVRAAMTAQHARWLQQAGAEVVDAVDVEICPLWALDAEEVSQKGVQGTRVTESRYFC
ncbi:MAG: UTP--glucose-1-phosphate uridylyltransferase [Thermoguttaceae bacterium]